MRKGGVRYLYLLAIALGLVRVFGSFAGLPFFYELGRAVAIAPNPTPYTRIDRISPSQIDHQLSFACEVGPQPLVWHRWDYNFRASVPGPHRRTIALLNFFALAQSNSLNPDGRGEFARMQQFYFCRGGPLAAAADCGPNVSAVYYKWWHPSLMLALPYVVRRACSP